MVFASIIGFAGSFFLTGGICLLGGLDFLPSLAFAIAGGGITVITIECITLHNPDIEIIPWPVVRVTDENDIETPKPSAPELKDTAPTYQGFAPGFVQSFAQIKSTLPAI